MDPDNTGHMADSGYADAAREADLKQRGYQPAIQHEGQARQLLSKAAKRRNHRIARDRVFGEHPFARLTQPSAKYLRNIGLARAKVVAEMEVVSHNLMRQHGFRIGPA